MNVFEQLEQEHQLISEVLKIAGPQAQRQTPAGAEANPVGRELTEFCERFVSKCHQAKEFNLFLRLLQKGGSSVIVPIIGFHTEHTRLARMAGSLGVVWSLTAEAPTGDWALASGYLADYVALLLTHLAEEDRFYQANRTVLEAYDLADLGVVFDQLEQTMLGAGGYQRYCRWAKQLMGTASGADDQQS